MRRILTLLVFISPALAVAADDAPVKVVKKIPAIALLPDGSELKGVMLPRYDENRKLVGVVKSEAMTLVDAGRIAGRGILIEFFDVDQASRGTINLTSATFYQEKGLLAAKEPVEIKSDRLNATGSGLSYSFTEGKGFLSGPGSTTIKLPPRP